MALGRTPYDDFYNTAFRHWIGRDYGGLYRYLFNADLTSPYSDPGDGGGGGGFHNWLDGVEGGDTPDPTGHYYHLTAAEYAGTWAHFLQATATDVIPLIGIRSNADTNSYASSLWLKHVTSGDMAAGFATGILFTLQDATSGAENLARFGMVRGSGDTVGDFFWSTSADGTIFTERMRLTQAGNLGIGATLKVYYDGTACTGNTYTAEASADYLLDTVGGTATLGRTAGHIGVPATGRLYFDGVACSGNTYIYESAADTLDDMVGGSLILRRTATLVTIPLAVATADNRLHIGDGTHGFFMGGGTATAARMSPIITLYPTDANDGGGIGYVLGQVDADSDAGTNPVIRFDSRRVGAKIVTRPPFAFFNYDLEMARFEPSGQLLLAAGVTGASPTPMLSFGSYYDNAGSASISHINLYGGLYGFGITGVTVNYITGGHHHFMINSALAATDGIFISNTDAAVYSATDNVNRLGKANIGWSALDLSDANTTVPSTAGEVRMRDAGGGLEFYMGGTLHDVSGRIYSLATPLTTGVVSTYDADIDASACSIPGGVRRAGKTIKIFVTGTAKLHCTGINLPVGSVKLNLDRAGGTDTLAEWYVADDPTENRHWFVRWTLEAMLTCESSSVVNALGRTMRGETTTASATDPWPVVPESNGQAVTVYLWPRTAADEITMTADTAYHVHLRAYIERGASASYIEVTQFTVTVEDT